MLGLPQVKQIVRVWPAPGRRVQDGARVLDEGGRFLSAEGRDVAWTEFHYEQLRSGDLFLHDPLARGCADCETSHRENADCDAGALAAAAARRAAPAAPAPSAEAKE
jgi:hypothetical protein